MMPLLLHIFPGGQTAQGLALVPQFAELLLPPLDELPELEPPLELLDELERLRVEPLLELEWAAASAAFCAARASWEAVTASDGPCSDAVASFRACVSPSTQPKA